MSLTYGEMFAGYGGLGMGAQFVLGGEMAWCAEIDPAPTRILAHHWPHVPNLGDVTKVDWDTVPKVDVLTGGFPCQDVSHAGKRLGLRPGTRTGLWSHMAYAIDKLRPSLVVAENVRGLLSATADGDLEPCPWCVGDGPSGALRALGAVLGDLADLRYDAWWCGLRAADVGAAHGRFRVFVFATPADAERESGWAAWRTGSANDGVQTGETGGTTGCNRPIDDLTLLPTPAVNDMGTAYTPQQWDEWTERMRAEHGNGNGHGKSLAIEAQRLLRTPTAQLAVNGGSQHPDKRKGGGHGPTLADEVEHLLPTPRAQHGEPRNQNIWERPADQPQNLENALAHVGHHVQDWREYEAAIRRHETAFGRPAPPPTEPGRNGQPRLSPAFVEWLMGLPADHVIGVPGLTRNDQLKVLGNGVVPQQAAAATQAFLEFMAGRWAA